MTRTLNMILTDAASGDLFPLHGLIHFLLFDCPLTDAERFARLTRIYKIASDRFGLPANVVTETLCYLF